MNCKGCKNYYRNYLEQSNCGGNFEKSSCEFYEQISREEALKVKPSCLVTSPSVLVGMTSVLWKRENKFVPFMFQRLYGSLNDDDNRPYVETYQFEIEELMKEMYCNLSIILKVYDEYTIDDVIKVFILNFWDMKVIVDSDFETLAEIAYKYDELYGDSIGDKPTFEAQKSKEQWRDKVKAIQKKQSS